MKLHDAGEFGLIQSIQKKMPSLPAHITMGIGDDAALYEIPENHFSVITTDSLIQGVHFDLDYTPWEALGWKSLAVNLSDLAAMGAKPTCAVLSFALTDKVSVENMDLFYQGLIDCSQTFKCPIVGGDTTSALNDISIHVTVIGHVEKDKQIPRSGANVGDMICVTGSLGKSATGFEILSKHIKSEMYPQSPGAFLKPLPRLKEAAILAESDPVTAMIDISDGLAADLNQLCQASQTGCMLQGDQIPISDETYVWAKRSNLDPVQFTLQSGEEYELLFTVSLEQFEPWHTTFQNKLDYKVIGQMTSQEEGLQIIQDDEVRDLEIRGWDHFKR